MMDELPYTAISLSILARFVFIYLLYRNRSTNIYSLVFCLMNIASSGIWLKYSVDRLDRPMMIRSSTEIGLLCVSSVYILVNRVRGRNAVLPA